ncbi:MAG: exodeoxyribonuclease VII small subunit [Candidatus Eisenbacteria bacterium]
MAREKNAKAGGSGEAEAGFEQSMTELERIVEELEGGQLTLDDSLSHYEKGMGLARELTRTLDQAEKRIEKLVEAEAAGAAPFTTPLEGGDTGRDGGEGELPF